MERVSDIDLFATQLRMLKDRSGRSYERLARQAGISGSSLHRYCSGLSVPADYGVIHAFAKACGATREEMRTLHRLWALADANRDAVPAAGPEDQPAPPVGAELEDQPAQPIGAQPDNAPLRPVSAEPATPAGFRPDEPTDARPDLVLDPAQAMVATDVALPQSADDEGRSTEAAVRSGTEPAAKPGSNEGAPVGRRPEPLADSEERDSRAGTAATRLRAKLNRQRSLVLVVIVAVAVVGAATWIWEGPGRGRVLLSSQGRSGILFSEACQGPVSMGQHDECAREVQSLLVRAGAKLVVDGDFGPNTLRKVTAFQVLAGLPPRGVVDDRTKSALYANRVSMATWSPEQVEKRIREVFPEEPDRAVGIARCQSFLDPLWVLPNTNGSRNWGIFQISDSRLRDLGGSPQKAYDPEWNITAARRLWSMYRDFRHWQHCDAAWSGGSASASASPTAAVTNNPATQLPGRGPVLGPSGRG